jgi:hypothetical protein
MFFERKRRSASYETKRAKSTLGRRPLDFCKTLCVAAFIALVPLRWLALHLPL